MPVLARTHARRAAVLATLSLVLMGVIIKMVASFGAYHGGQLWAMLGLTALIWLATFVLTWFTRDNILRYNRLRYQSVSD